MPFQFIHLGFLAAGAAAVTLPIWIHLLLRQRARPMEIGSVRFLQAVVRRTKQRQRIRRWLLLALRCLAVLLLGLLFARPYLPAAPADGRTREAILMIDRSASMQVMTGNDTAFARAVELAAERIAALGDQARIQIGLFDADGVETIELEELDDAAPGYAATNYAEAFAWCTDILTSSDRTDRSVVFLSDLQASGLDTEALGLFPPDVLLEIIDVGSSVSQNLAVESAQPTQIEIRPGVPISLSVRLHNAGALPVSEVPVSVQLSGPAGGVTQQQVISLKAGGRATLDFPLEIAEPGIVQGHVELDWDDPLPWDNRRYVAFEVRHPDRVLLVDGDPGRNEYDSDTYFLETALRLTTPMGDAPARTFEVERLVWDRGEGFPDLGGFRLIVLANVGRFTGSDAARLREFLDDGGNVLLFAGDRMTPAVFEALQQSQILPAGPPPSARDLAGRVTEVAVTHPALAPFADPQHGDLRRLTVSRLIDLAGDQPAGEDRWDAVLLRSGDLPVMTERSVGAGRLILVATTADRGWNDWPRSRLYVPLVRQMAAWLTGQLDPRQSVNSRLATAAAPPGIGEEDDTLLVRNTDPRESQVQRLTPDQLREQLGLPVDPQAELKQQAQALAIPGVARSDELWPIVVWILLAALAAETLLASRIAE